MHQDGEPIRIMLKRARPHEPYHLPEDRVPPRQMSPSVGVNGGKMIVHRIQHVFSVFSVASCSFFRNKQTKKEEQETTEKTEKNS